MEKEEIIEEVLRLIDEKMKEIQDRDMGFGVYWHLEDLKLKIKNL